MRIRGKASSHSFCAAIEQGDSIKSPEVAIPTKEEKEKVLIEEEIHTEPPIVIATFPLPHFLKKQSNEPEQSTNKQSNEPEQSTKKQSNEPEPSTKKQSNEPEQSKKKQSNEPEQSKKRQRFEHESNEEVPLFFTVRRKRTPRIEVKRIKNNNYYMEEQVELQQPELLVNNYNNMEEQNELQQPELLVNNNNNNNMGHEQNELQPPELPVNNNNNNMEEQNELQPPELPVNNNNNNMEEQNDPDQPELPVNNNNNNMGHEQNDPGQPELPVINNNNNMEQEHNDPDQPVLPIEVQEKIQELGGSEVKLVIQKKLHKSDVNAGHNRFSIPSQQILARDFLTQEEVTLLNGREGGKPAGLTVNVLDPSLELWEGLRLKKWEMTSSPTYNIIGGWMKVVKNSGLEPEDVVQLWSFRSNGQLNFALVKL
ncbi:uncharacterized protein LOC130732800 [Lotus japonicus]|uniref:uncharacterized protein LOC130732800 n=1 Tax=Lotus japonicus TaxID=34305 RepID=UPI00258DE37C|nr:uncharacterized protein LOC130732800 [Lotus japonicus]